MKNNRQFIGRRLFVAAFAAGILLVGTQMQPGGLADGRGGMPYAQSGPAVSFDTDGLRFGNQVVGEESPPRRITATNTGLGSLYVNSVEVKGENWKEFRVVRDNCTGRTLAPGRSCVVDVSFAPAETGDRAAGLLVNDSAPDGPHRITLTGAGINSVDVPPFDGDQARTLRRLSPPPALRRAVMSRLQSVTPEGGIEAAPPPRSVGADGTLRPRN